MVSSDSAQAIGDEEPEAQSSVPELIRALHARLHKDFEIAEADISVREARLQAEMALCAAERTSIRRKREALAQTEALYRAHFEHSDILSPSQAIEMRDLDRAVGLAVHVTVGASASTGAETTTKKPQKKARIGDQRYRMFVCLSGSKEYTDVQIISVITGVTERRVRDQMAEDTANGFVRTAPEGDMYVLTEQGSDLLARFIASRNARGIPLPSATGPITDNDSGSDDEETGQEGEE